MGRLAKRLALIEEKHLNNIRIYDGDARYLPEALPDRSLERIYLLYPDPWPMAQGAAPGAGVKPFAVQAALNPHCKATLDLCQAPPYINARDQDLSPQGTFRIMVE